MTATHHHRNELFLSLGGTVALLLFAVLTLLVRSGHQFRIDYDLLWAIHRGGSPWLDSCFKIITNTGGVVCVALVTVILIAYYQRQKRPADALFLSVAMAGSAGLNVLFKTLCQRPRPQLWQHLVRETDFSFPSGHAMASSSLAFCIIYLAWHGRYRWSAIISGGIYMGLVGYSRLYVGVHYPSDIVGGWLLSASFVTLLIAVRRRLCNTKQST